jgi:Mn-dependent DtxR family transcriptional regulator
MMKELGQVCNVDSEKAKEACERLIKLKYIDEKGHLTSYGINAAVEVLEREKLAKVGLIDGIKNEGGFKKRISREL